MVREVSESRPWTMFEGYSVDIKALVALTHRFQDDLDPPLQGTHLKTLTAGKRIENRFREHLHLN